MFKHILVAVDGSNHSDKAIALALRMAGDDPAVRISALLVALDYGLPEYAHAMVIHSTDGPALRDELAAEARTRLSQLLKRYGEHAARIVPLVKVGDRPFEHIAEAATQEHCDLIVMAPRGHGAVAGALLGSQTQRVLSVAKVPVLVAGAVAHGDSAVFKNVLVATDGSEHADKAVALALSVARGRVVALMVVPDHGEMDFGETGVGASGRLAVLRERALEDGRRRLDASLARQGTATADVQRRVVAAASAAQEIVDTAKRDHHDLIVMATRGRGALASMLLGSQTQRVIAQSHVPVLVAT